MMVCQTQNLSSTDFQKWHLKIQMKIYFIFLLVSSSPVFLPCYHYRSRAISTKEARAKSLSRINVIMVPRLLDLTSFAIQLAALSPQLGGELIQNAGIRSGGRFKEAYELLNLRALKFSMLYEMYIFQCMGKIFCVEFQRVPLKFHTKYLTHTLKNTIFIQHWNFKSSWI